MNFLKHAFIYQTHTSVPLCWALCRVLGMQWWANQTWSHPLRAYILVEWDYSPLKYWMRKEGRNLCDNNLTKTDLSNTEHVHFPPLCHFTCSSQITHQNSYPSLPSHEQDTEFRTFKSILDIFQLHSLWQLHGYVGLICISLVMRLSISPYASKH